MRQFSKLWVLGLTLLFSLGFTIQSKAQGPYDYDAYDGYDNNYVGNYQDFYDDLAPYGRWLYDPSFGYVWMPNVGRDFRPYFTNGYWAMTQFGNTWVSLYDWGWAPFHYGRWTYDGYYGWLWIPGNEWAPAWVSWRSNNNYYGWAPIGPGVNINISLGNIPVDWWTFCNPNYFYQPRFQRFCNTDWRFTRSVYNQTNYLNYTYGNRRSFYTGPRVEDYRRHTGRQPSMFRIENNNRRGGTQVRGQRINMYRPSMRNSENYAPARIVPTERRISNRPETFNTSNSNIAGREIILNQTPVDNSRRSRINNSNEQMRNDGRGRLDNNSPNNENRRYNHEDTRQRENIEQQRIQQEEARQREKEQRDAFMIQQREQEKRRSEQTEESNRQRMQRMREEQIRREQETQRLQQNEQRGRVTQPRNDQFRRENNFQPQRNEVRPSAPMPNSERNSSKPSFAPRNESPVPSGQMEDRSRGTQMPEGRGLRGRN